MTIMNIAEAKSKLSELVARAEAGEEVTIARNGKPAVRLIATEPPEKKRRPLGLWSHLGLELDERKFLERDFDLEDAAHGPIFPPDE